MPDPEVPGQVSTSARYEDIQFHAAGGLGEVYRATDGSLRRDVALKFIQQRHLEKQEYLELFFLEAEITSRLDHPGVVPVYGVGEAADKRPFYAMRYIEGVPLRDAIENYHQTGAAPRELHRLLTHLVAVCNTVAYAHNRGVVHCDIKPENIMLGKFGETLLVDWGLATTVERDERARASGEKTMRVKEGNPSGKSSGGAAGTVGYMSPEQHPGFMDPIRPASDIYSLGATLYCVLTGHAPLEGSTETLLLDKLRYGAIPRPSEVNSHVPKALEAVCLKAMAQYQAERYPTALEMAADLEAWMVDDPVSAHRETTSHRLARWARRNRALVILGLIGLALVSLVALGSAIMLRNTAAREVRARAKAEDARQEAEEARQNAVVAQENGMRLASRFAAKAVANEVDRRWRILARAAEDPELQRLMLARQDKDADSPEQRGLQQWIDARKKAESPDAESWFLTDAHGVQIAREPFNEKTMFADFSERTYFHGGPRNLTAEEKRPGVKPIDRPHLSSVFLSNATGDLRVAFSTPVWKDNKSGGECLGVLGMSMELGSFYELQTGLEAGQIAALVDTREDQADGAPKSGLILHHPLLPKTKPQRPRTEKDVLFRIDPQLVDRLKQLRERRAQETGDASVSGLTKGIDAAYHDPLAAEPNRTVTAAFEPVRIESRPPELRDTGWVVIVQESPLQPRSTPTD